MEEEQVPCSHAGCTALVRSKNFVNHLLKCPHGVVHCVFEYLGCKIQVKQEKLREHIRHCSFGRSTVAATAVPSTSRAANSDSLGIPCVFQPQGCPVKMWASRMEWHKSRCPFRGMPAVVVPTTSQKIEPKAPTPSRVLKKSSVLVPCTFQEFGCTTVLKQSSLDHHTSRCSFKRDQYCQLLGLSDCLLSSKVADWPAHASKVHGISAVWTRRTDFDVTIDYKKTGQERDLEWLKSIDWKPVAIAVQANKPYTLWLKTEIIPGERIAWMITHSGESGRAVTAKMTFYNIREEKISWTWRGPVMSYDAEFNEKCFNVPCTWLLGQSGWKLRIRVCEASLRMKKIANVFKVWKDPYEATIHTDLDSSTAGITLEGRTASSNAAVADIGKQSSGKEMSPEATFAALQQRREFDFGINSLLDSLSELGNAEGKNEEEKSKQPDFAKSSGLQ